MTLAAGGLGVPPYCSCIYLIWLFSTFQFLPSIPFSPSAISVSFLSFSLLHRFCSLRPQVSITASPASLYIKASLYISSHHCLNLQEFPSSNSQERNNLLVSKWIVCVWVTSFSYLLTNNLYKESSALSNSSWKEKATMIGMAVHSSAESNVDVNLQRIVDQLK